MIFESSGEGLSIINRKCFVKQKIMSTLIEIPLLLDALKKTSALLGSNFLITQGPGGNTSLKVEDTLWVKASGKWLSNACVEDIFLPLSLSGILKDIQANLPDPVGANCLVHGPLRPSIETSLHALIPHPAVIHVHALNTLSFAVMMAGEEQLIPLLEGLNWVWVPYYKPGVDLTQAISRILLNKIPDIFILANHGLVVGAAFAEVAKERIFEVEKRLEKTLRPFCSEPGLQLFEMANRLGMVLPQESKIHTLALDPISFKIGKQGILYPDQVVFLGEAPLVIEKEMDPEQTLQRYLSRYRKPPVYAIIESQGVLVCPSSKVTLELMLLCQTFLLSKISEQEKLCFLTDQMVDALVHWEAEHYRQSMVQ